MAGKGCSGGDNSGELGGGVAEFQRSHVRCVRECVIPEGLGDPLMELLVLGGVGGHMNLILIGITRYPEDVFV